MNDNTLPVPPEVLVVDDNPATCYSTSRVLRAAGFRTREAGTGAEALAGANASLAAVVLDVHLPDINGFEVCTALRLRPDTARVPVVYLSAAHVRDDDKVRGLHSGADAYMTHPVEPALLVATVQALVRARTAEEGMRRSEARFRAIFDQALSGICLVDTSARFVGANAAMLAMLGRELSEVVGARLPDLAPPPWADRIAAYLDESSRGQWRGVFPLLNRSGELVHFEWNLSAHIEPGVIMATAIDITARVTLEQQRAQLLEAEQAARAAAERSSRQKDEFVAVVSHELRTPLNAILSWVHVLQRSSTADQLARGLAAIERNAKTQTRLIADVLDVSRMDLGKMRLELQSLDAAELVRSSASALAGPLLDKALEVSIDTQTVREPIVADAARLQQIIWNLLTNAIKFSARGGRIHVRLRQDAAALEIVVRDEGQGIAPAFLPQIFDRFTQSDSASNRYHGGLGLGLAIVKQLVELHDGSVTAESDGPGTGACFTVTLPMRRLPLETLRAQERRREEAEARTDAAYSLSGIRVLAVEDDAEAREMLAIILRDRGASVVAVASADEALQSLAAGAPDVLVSDIGMPGQDGYALVREIRRREPPDSPRLPAVALTAFARPQDREMALAAGFDAHCAKPLRPNDLVAAILACRGGHGGSGG